MLRSVATPVLVGMCLIAFNAGTHGSQCTNRHVGVSSCRFDSTETGMCSWLPVSESGGDSKWTLVQPGDDGPLAGDNRSDGMDENSGGYIYAQGDDTQEAAIEAYVALSVRAMCINFQYATVGENEIEIYQTIDGRKQVVHTLSAEDTSGRWEWFGLSCCLKAGENRKIGFASKNTSNLVALDDLEMRLSLRECGKVDDQDVCTLLPIPQPKSQPSTPKTHVVASQPSKSTPGTNNENVSIGKSGEVDAPPSAVVPDTAASHPSTDTSYAYATPSTTKTDAPFNRKAAHSTDLQIRHSQQQDFLQQLQVIQQNFLQQIKEMTEGHLQSLYNFEQGVQMQNLLYLQQLQLQHMQQLQSLQLQSELLLKTMNQTHSMQQWGLQELNSPLNSMTH